MYVKTWRVINEVSSWTVLWDGNRQRAAKQRQARPLLHHSLRTYPSPSPRTVFISLSPVNVFSMCVCAPLRVHVCYLQTSQTEQFTLWGKVCSSALWDTVCLFPCQYHQYHRWQRARRDVELCGQTEVSLFHTRDTSLRSRWMRKTRAPERPCHPGKYNFTLTSLKDIKR